ncbi:CPBP family intramembrane glutamic endopeptidase [Sporosarcina newyorkensis]|uniref:CPBP family intramembrane glutamic endopeptidase n=1 Tax=Sporosarcina newyorkensis TaxID=759851 RepID=UPI003CFEDF35
MSETKDFYLVAMSAMVIVSFANFFGLTIGGISVILGITFFITSRVADKTTSPDTSLSLKTIGPNFKNKSLWFWIFSPLLMNLFCIILATLFLPEFIEHLIGRTGTMISLDTLFALILQLAILALGEEIAWRGFFQKQLSTRLPILPALILTSFLFSIAHYTVGNFAVISYDMFFIFINSMLYGFVFYKTTNIWISAISHFTANLFIIIIFSFM